MTVVSSAKMANLQPLSTMLMASMWCKNRKKSYDWTLVFTSFNVQAWYICSDVRDILFNSWEYLPIISWIFLLKPKLLSFETNIFWSKVSETFCKPMKHPRPWAFLPNSQSIYSVTAAIASTQDNLFLKPYCAGHNKLPLVLKSIIRLCIIFSRTFPEEFKKLIGQWFAGSSLVPFLRREMSWATCTISGKYSSMLH